MRKTILLADDSPTIRRLVTQTFADADFKIVEVSNGDAAIKAVEEIKPNLVLADIYMPGKNGYEVCTFIRNHPVLNAVPVILLVGAFDAFNDETAKRVGATGNIKKPFEPRALIELVKSALSGDAGTGSEPEPVRETRPEPQPELRREVQPEPRPQPQPQPEPSRAFTPSPAAAPAPTPEPVAAAAPAPAAPAPAQPAPTSEADDLLGLQAIFVQGPAPAPAARGLSEDEVDRIVDRVIQKLSTQIIESIAWDVVPDITEKIVRQELKRINES
jgi:CheY-like chemotaxis protein